VRRSILTLEDGQGRSQATRSKDPRNFKRIYTKMSEEQTKGAILWNRCWIKFRFPVPRMTLFDDITNSYLKLVEKVEMTFQHRKPRSIYTDLHFRSEMEDTRAFYTKKEDTKTKKARLR
jgi:hypothetical protein